MTTVAGLASANPDLGPLTVELDQAIYEPGQQIDIKITGQPNDLAFLLLSGTPGSVEIPPYGTLRMALQPLPIFIPVNLGAEGERVLSCNVDCESPIVKNPCFLQAVSFNVPDFEVTGFSEVTVLRMAAGDCGRCPEQAPSDPELGVHSGGHAFWLPGIGKDFVFVAGGNIVERGDGTGMISGVIARKSDPQQAFVADVQFGDRVDAYDPGFPPPGSPKKELTGAAYSENGGPIFTDTWRYYQTVNGTLTGVRDFAGALLNIERRGPAFQLGYGANGKNLNMGGSTWLRVTTESQPDEGDPFPETVDGDINIDIDEECPDCATMAGDHSITMKAFGNNFEFVSGGDFMEYSDGTARLSGLMRHTSDPANAWDVEINFFSRVNPGAPVYPPPGGSPKKELSGSAYKDNGGPVDPSTWHYYLTTVGLMEGVDDNEGAVLSIHGTGPAMQVGFGANGKSVRMGGSAWLNIQVTTQSNAGGLPEGVSKGDINIDLNSECP